MNQAGRSDLVIGGDGIVGGALSHALRASGRNVIATTRRPELVAPNRPFFELGKSACVLGPTFGVGGTAYICAGITSMATCASDPMRTRHANVDATIALANVLASSGMRVVFLSSNTVFDGLSVHPHEDAVRQPTTEYGRQKVATEDGILALQALGVVVRISKVLCPELPLIAGFSRSLLAGEPFDTFDDLMLSPISLGYLCRSLMHIGGLSQAGVFHLSGAVEWSYTDLARAMARRLAVGAELVRAESSQCTDRPILFRPAHPALGMSRTALLCGIDAESPDTVLDAIVGPSRAALSAVNETDGVRAMRAQS